MSRKGKLTDSSNAYKPQLYEKVCQRIHCRSIRKPASFNVLYSRSMPILASSAQLAIHEIINPQGAFKHLAVPPASLVNQPPIKSKAASILKTAIYIATWRGESVADSCTVAAHTGIDSWSITWSLAIYKDASSSNMGDSVG